MNDGQKKAIGDLWAKVLMLRKYRDGKYKTEWGRKTGLGLYETITKLTKDADRIGKRPIINEVLK